MTVLLNQPFKGYPSGQIVNLPKSIETALIARGNAQASTAVVTAGNVTTSLMRGTAGIAIGASSVTITNENVTRDSTVNAIVNQASADATALRVERISIVADGAFTIYVTANATAVTQVNWNVVNSSPVESD